MVNGGFDKKLYEITNYSSEEYRFVLYGWGVCRSFTSKRVAHAIDLSNKY